MLTKSARYNTNLTSPYMQLLIMPKTEKIVAPAKRPSFAASCVSPKWINLNDRKLDFAPNALSIAA